MTFLDTLFRRRRITELEDALSVANTVIHIRSKAFADLQDEADRLRGVVASYEASNAELRGMVDALTEERDEAVARTNSKHDFACKALDDFRARLDSDLSDLSIRLTGHRLVRPPARQVGRL